MKDHWFPVCVHTALATLALIASTTTPARSADPAKTFPSFEGRKSALGPVALVGDVVVVEDVNGHENRVYLEDCLYVGRSLLYQLSSQLERKGYSFSRKTLVTVGNVMSGEAQYRLLDRWDQHKEDSARFPLRAPPFYGDSTLCASDSARAAWHALFTGVWAFEEPSKESASAIPSAIELRDPIGADVALVVVVVSAQVATSRELMSGLPLFGGPERSVGKFRSPVEIEKFAGVGIKLVVVDCRSGEVLWADHEQLPWRASLHDYNVPLLTKSVLKRMP